MIECTCVECGASLESTVKACELIDQSIGDGTTMNIEVDASLEVEPCSCMTNKIDDLETTASEQETEIEELENEITELEKGK